MKKLTYSNIAIMLGLGFLVFLYFRSKKDAAAAVKTITPIGDSPKPIGSTGGSTGSSSDAGSTAKSATGPGGELTGPVPVIGLGGIGSGSPIGRNVYIINNNTYSGDDGTASTGGGLSGTSGGGTTAGNTTNTTGNTGFA